MDRDTAAATQGQHYTDQQEILLDAAQRLEHLARRLGRKQDFLGEWTVRAVAWDLIMCANGPEARPGA